MSNHLPECNNSIDFDTNKLLIKENLFIKYDQSQLHKTIKKTYLLKLFD